MADFKLSEVEISHGVTYSTKGAANNSLNDEDEKYACAEISMN